MKTIWIEPNITTGNVARGAKYFRRLQIEKAIIQEIEKGNHILIAAPRRYGKSSIIRYLSDNKCNNYTCVFEDIEDVISEKQFYERFYKMILKSLKFNKRIWNKLGDFLQKIGVEEASISGKITFTSKKEIDYKEEIDKILITLRNEKVKIILFIDELAEVLHELNKIKKTQDAKNILRSLRHWRQNEQYNSFCTVFSSSIGLHHVIKEIQGRTAIINDLHIIKLAPFSNKTAMDYINYITETATVKYSKALQKHFFTKINFLIPYFINILVERVNLTAKAKKQCKITKKDIDIAFDYIVAHSTYFKDWKDRLFEYFPKEVNFMNEVLTYIAHYDSINSRQLYDLAVKHNCKTTYIASIDILENDGYIHAFNTDYLFVSPFLKAFWKKFQPVYDEK